ncbi:MAG: hypothetical protein VYE73_00420 [Acidobacteriota bacterium]|nr:hypothetical protein [Acidobacteriota bacterium]
MRSDASRQPFLRGVVTRDLVRRGLPFEDAYSLARAVRARIRGRAEIETTELRELIQEELAVALGDKGVVGLNPPGRPSPLPTVTYDGADAQPFSRGLLARSLLAAGVDGDSAYRLATDAQTALLAEDVEVVHHEELALRLGALLEVSAGKAAARRYRTMRRIGRLDKPLVAYVSGSTGSGKSTLALELAPLLGVYQISATDTIRQVMRMVFAPAILPGIHRSSFEAAGSVGKSGDPKAESVVRAFEDQAVRVLVGVRAVVDRAIAESVSVVIEGVHLLPPFVPFSDLEGDAYQVMIMLATFDEEVHRSRFLRRGAIGSRLGERYLRHFASIRAVQKRLLERAGDNDVSVLVTEHADDLVVSSLELVAEQLVDSAPWVAEPPGEPRRTPMLCLLIDGLADRPVRALGDRTPLAAADTPTLDRLAREGVCGLADPLEREVVPDTASGTLALFGQPAGALGRGPVEALGVGLKIRRGDVALRGNFATLDEHQRIVDRRAGRIREGTAELAAALDGMRLSLDGVTVKVRVRAATEHRLSILLRGEDLSSAILGSDPGDGAQLARPLVPSALDPDDAAAARTADVLKRFELAARERLAAHPVNEGRRREGLAVANAILTRGAGRLHRLGPISVGGQPLSTTCVGGDYTVLGVAAALGARVVSGAGMTANLDSDLHAKFDVVFEELKERDLVVVHFKGADIASHDLRPDLKVSYLERLDRELARFLERRSSDLRVAVAADHATLSELGRHGADPVPVLVWGHDVAADGVVSFDEASVASGRLRRFALRQLLERGYGPLS